MKESNLCFHWELMEQFYSDLAEAFKGVGRSAVYSEDSPKVDDVTDFDLLLFEQHLCFDPYDSCSSAEKPLAEVTRKEYEILMNFHAPDVILGNVIVRLGDKWFAFGQCENDPHAGEYVAELWSLKYVLTRMDKMEVKPAHTVPLDIQSQ